MRFTMNVQKEYIGIGNRNLTSKGIIVFAVFLFLLLSWNCDGVDRKSTLDQVKKDDFLKCGVSQGLPGFSFADESGKWAGIDVDFCRAVAAAVLGDTEKVKYSPLNAKERFTALQSGEVDLLSRNTTITISRDIGLGLAFAGVSFYDGQGFMVRKNSGINSVADLRNVSVCVQLGTTTELNLRDFFEIKKVKYEPVVFETDDEVLNSYVSGRCDTYTTDRSGLAANRSRLKNPEEHRILPEVISKEPLGPAVREGDAKWEDIVRWTLNLMIEAEEYGITSKNIESLRSTENPAIQRIIGVDATIGEGIGLNADWGYQIISQVGNYGESYDRNLGVKTPINLERGLNDLYTKGGILYAPPLR